MIQMVTLLVVVASVSFFLGVLVYSRGSARQLTLTVDRLERTVDRIETGSQVVAVNLAATSEDLKYASEQRTMLGHTLDRMESATHVIAENLADSVSRADATEGPEGAAADAALRTGDTSGNIHRRQDSQPKE